jgi:hypothetical protein
MLREAAAAPGYTFYRAAARDTLGSAAWRDVAPARVARAGDRCEVAGAADELAAVGALDEAGMLLARLTGNAPAGTEPAGCGGTEGVLAGARSAYALGRIGLGVALARRALDLAAEGEVEGEWEVVPWGFPPAFDSLLASARDPVVATLEPALLFALAWQESRFDPRARSRSDALGLMQLKLATARDVARRAGEPEPGAASLFDAERSVRYGGRYLARLLGRCDGSVAAALCAYNAGPAALRLDWRRLRERGGEALVCELASNPLAQDYAKAILAARAAYRELRPTTTP